MKKLKKKAIKLQQKLMLFLLKKIFNPVFKAA